MPQTRKVLKVQVDHEYSMINSRLASSGVEFMNHGLYDKKLIKKIPGDFKNQKLLYYSLFDGVKTKGKSILEVGCGRGGGIKFLRDNLKFSKITAIDYNQANIDFCKENNSDGVEFLLGDAENLEFENESFDIVLNVESAHCYPDYQKFVSEVHRVLKPNGIFLSADTCDVDDSNSDYYSSNLLSLKNYQVLFSVLEKDITPQVAESCARDYDSYMASEYTDATKELLFSIAVTLLPGYNDGRFKYISAIAKKVG